MSPTGSVRTENYFTPIYMESQETDHTNVNANQRTPTHEDTRYADLANVAAATATEVDAMEAGAEAAIAAELISRRAAEAEAAAVAEAAAAEAAAKVATNTASRLAAEEAAAAEAATEAKRAAEAAEAAAKAQEATAYAEADKNKQEALAVATAVAAAAAAAKATADEKAAATAVKEKGKIANESQKAKVAKGSTSGIPTIAQQALNNKLPPDHDDWELSKGDLPEESNLSGNIDLLEEYPEDQANSKKTKKTNTGKGKKGNLKPHA
jgi:hypothetical protein